jgi:hypothetical protein
MQQQIVNLLSIQPPPQKENVEALLKEANNFPLEFEELPRLQQLVSLGKVPCTLIFLFVQVFVHT